MEEKKPNVDETLDPNDFDEVNPQDEESSQSGNDLEEVAEEEPNQDDSSNPHEESEKENDKAKKNAHFAEQRRQKEAKEREARERRIREEAKLEAELGMVKKNPYNNEPIVDEEDLKLYKVMKELDEEGKDPIDDLPRRLAEINRRQRQIEKQKAEDKEAEERSRREKIDGEISELRKKYPKVDTAELAKDPLFQECLNGRAGRWTQVEIYELYLTKKNSQKSEESEKKAEEIANKMSKVPSAKSGSQKSSTKKVESMTDEEFARYWANLGK